MARLTAARAERVGERLPRQGCEGVGWEPERTGLTPAREDAHRLPEGGGRAEQQPGAYRVRTREAADEKGTATPMPCWADAAVAMIV